MKMKSAAMTGFQQRHQYADYALQIHDRRMTFWSFGGRAGLKEKPFALTKEKPLH